MLNKNEKIDISAKIQHEKPKKASEAEDYVEQNPESRFTQAGKNLSTSSNNEKKILTNNLADLTS